MFPPRDPPSNTVVIVQFQKYLPNGEFLHSVCHRCAQMTFWRTGKCAVDCILSLYRGLEAAISMCDVCLPAYASPICPCPCITDCLKRVTSYFLKTCRLSFCQPHVQDAWFIQMVKMSENVLAASFLPAWLIKPVSCVSEGEKRDCLAASCPWKCVVWSE